MLNLALHAAAGIVIAVVAVELMPRAIEADPAWLIVLGGGFYVAVDWATGRILNRFGGEGGSGSWIIFFGVSVDLFSDGILIGTGSTVAVGLGLLLALGQVPADLPEGFSSIAKFKDQGTPRRSRLLLSAAFAVPIFLGGDDRLLGDAGAARTLPVHAPHLHSRHPHYVGGRGVGA